MAELIVQAKSAADVVVFVEQITHPLADHITLDPAGGTEALGINNSGQIVGEYTDVNGNLHGYLLDNGTYYTIDIFGPDFQTEALGINNNGDIVGTYFDNLVGKGFVVNANTIIAAANAPVTPEETIDIGGVYTFSIGINDNSTIVGWWLDPDNGKFHGYRKDGNTVDSFDGSGDDLTAGFGINNAGQIVGATGTFDKAGNPWESEFGLLMESNLSMEEFSKFGSSVTAAWGINENGDISGFFQPNQENEQTPIGFVCLADGSAIQFEVPGATKTLLAGINDSRTLVGVYQAVENGPDIGFVAQLVVLGCDFTGDGLCGIDDLNAMLSLGPVAPGVPAAGNEQFDLTGDGVIDNSDVDQWLRDAATENGFGSSYKRGDADLDGVTDVVDFNAWNENKFTSSLNWDDGNYNGDEAVDVLDFNAWNANKFTSSDSVSLVPEPTAVCLLAMALLGLAGVVRAGV